MKQYQVTHQLETAAWSDFVMKHPDGNIFQTPEMFDVFDTAKNSSPYLTAITDENGKIEGLLVSVIQREHSGIVGQLTSRSVIWGGPLIKDDNPEVLDRLLKAYVKLIRKKAIFSQFRNLWQWKENKTVFHQNGFTYKDHLDILMDLTQTEEELTRNLHKERRHNIRRAAKKGTTFQELHDLATIKESLNLIVETYKRVSHPMPPVELFTIAYMKLYKKKMVRFFAVFNDGKIIGVRIVLTYKQLVYDWYAGSSFEDRNKYPNDFLPWEIILWGKQQGYTAFDFGGAGKPNVPYGVRDFKLKFGGKLFTFGRFTAVHKPLLMKLGKLGMKIYKNRKSSKTVTKKTNSKTTNDTNDKRNKQNIPD
jgi:serine/alanine adding enzyme